MGGRPGGGGGWLARRRGGVGERSSPAGPRPITQRRGHRRRAGPGGERYCPVRTAAAGRGARALPRAGPDRCRRSGGVGCAPRSAPGRRRVHRGRVDGGHRPRPVPARPGGGHPGRRPLLPDRMAGAGGRWRGHGRAGRGGPAPCRPGRIRGRAVGVREVPGPDRPGGAAGRAGRGGACRRSQRGRPSGRTCRAGPGGCRSCRPGGRTGRDPPGAGRTGSADRA